VDNKLKIAGRIVHRLRARGHEALLAGGCVRDHLLKRRPKDYDIATSARPMNVLTAFKHVQPVGAAFGVMLVIEEGEPFEVATFRADGSYSDGRHPDTITFTSAEEDARRRDFTVNALFMNPDGAAVIDYVGGRADLQARLIRAVGEPRRRFEEDKLRVLRAVRFAAELGFEIEAETFAQVKAYAPRITEVAWERVLQEMNKLLTGADPARGMELLRDSGLMDALLPEMKDTIGSTQTPRFHPEGDVWTHTLLVLRHLAGGDAPLMWAGLLHDIAKPATWSQDPDGRIRNTGHETLGAEMAAKICSRLKMSAQAGQRIVTLVADHLRFNHIMEMKDAKLKRLLRRDDIEDMLALHKADCLASHGGMELYDYAQKKRSWYAAHAARQPLKPKALADGNDLIALGLEPGPAFKEILAQLEDEQLEGRLHSREGALAWMKQQAQANPPPAAKDEHGRN
jgi:poly(A) polymerase